MSLFDVIKKVRPDSAKAASDLKGLVELLRMLPEEKWGSAIRAHIVVNPGLVLHVIEQGVRGALKDCGVDLDTIEQIVAVLKR